MLRTVLIWMVIRCHLCGSFTKNHPPTKVETMTLRSLAEAQAIAKILNPEVTNISSKAFTDDTIKALVAKMPKANISNKTKIGQ